MRFLENGPSIPNELLNARDKGEVVFFCGAGVSRKAGLPDFNGLTEAVLEKLGVSENDDAYKVFQEVGEITKRTNVSGLISADRIFGLLERKYHPRSVIEPAVANILCPEKKPDITNHRILLDLAKTEDGKTRLVTTNFDRLFNELDKDIRTWLPPRLPDPHRPDKDELDGIIYLHGRANEDYSGSEGYGFVLSSSNFGRAYLAEGWATRFFQAVIEKFIVVFIGYSADDPPISYLLEGLKAEERPKDRIFAFQDGESNKAVGLWEHKGVTAIPYSPVDNHSALWDSLKEWTIRVQDPPVWRRKVIELAKKGPEKLAPFQRGQVAHVVSTADGARMFCEGDAVPPAEWLCVFDPECRFAAPGSRTNGFGKTGSTIDPFDIYCLDSDIDESDPTKLHKDRKKKEESWDAFVINHFDKEDEEHPLSEHVPVFRGEGAVSVPRLPARIDRLGWWIARVADQPAAVWWAARQEALHQHVQSAIRQELDRSKKAISQEIRKAWRYLFEAWESLDDDSWRTWHDFQTAIKESGWSREAIRDYASVCRPYVKASRAIGAAPIPPAIDDDLSLFALVLVEIECPVPPHDLKIPDKWLAVALRELRKNIELAVQMELETGGTQGHNISPIIPDESPGIDHYHGETGLSGAVHAFASLFERLMELDIDTARREYDAWQIDDDSAFCRLRIWAAGKPELKTAHACAQVVLGISDDAFWRRDHQRDLLHTLANRWEEFSIRDRKSIEKGLLKGQNKWEGMNEDDFRRYSAWDIMSRLQWLKSHDCEFSFDLDVEINRLHQNAPDWKHEYGDKAAASMEARACPSSVNTDCSELLCIPIPEIIPKSCEISDRSDDNFHQIKKPFTGLSVEYPILALKALIHAAGQNEYPKREWEIFLSTECRGNDDVRFSAFTACMVSNLPDGPLAAFLHSATDWFSKAGILISSEFPDVYHKAITKFIDVILSHPSAARSALLPTKTNRDWVFESINAPAGHIANVLVNYPGLDELQEESGFPDEWLELAENLLSLQGAPRQHAIVIFSLHLNWLFHFEVDWVERNLLKILDEANEDDRSALLSGFLWSAEITHPDLYSRLKPDLIAMAKEVEPSSPGLIKPLAALMLSGWSFQSEGSVERLISNKELRETLSLANDEFRSHALWTISRWMEDKDDKAREKWATLSLVFLQEVWPREKTVQNSTMSIRLCKFIFSSGNLFPELAGIVELLLTKIDNRRFFGPDLSEKEQGLARQYPEKVLMILHKVLADIAKHWPYGVNGVLKAIEEADPNLATDKRMIELKRRWESR
jgi:hypothetical protein